ncbi:MAG: phosphoenolpyruvate carboxykinase (ATP) [bacterium]|nr:phosphoenolpyruvate carboxykinase (ATP) [bacterium]
MEKDFGLSELGLTNLGNVSRNLPPSRLVELAILNNEGYLASNGALVVRTGERTGRSPNDRYVVREPSTEKDIWWGDVNVETDRDVFDHVFSQIKAFYQDRDAYIFQGYSGANREYALPVRVVTTLAWQGLFAHTLFIRPTPEELKKHEPGFTIIDAYPLQAEKIEGLRSSVYVTIDFERKLVIIAGSGYGGEIKKSAFSIMNYLLPKRGVLPMHNSANVGEDGDSALFFGLSGTGKTTLSADPKRRLIGDDQHGWCDDGIFNFEGGCYAKCINLSQEAEPQIYDAIKFGSLLENVITTEDTITPDYDASDITENTRATYPVEYIPNCITSGVGPHPKNVFFLTADAFGVLPPISKLTPEQAMYHFISGYTAKLAGTEAGVTEPSATFSACFGAPFLPLHPSNYAELLAERLTKHGANCWLVNTGWSGGAYGVGERMPIKLTRALLSAALEGKLDDVAFEPDPVFRVLVPVECPDVPNELLVPKNTWDDTDAYDKAAVELAKMFASNFEKFAEGSSQKITEAGPVIE